MYMNVVCDLSCLLFYCNTIIYVKMSTDEEIHSPRLSNADLPTKMLTNKKIQSVNLNCEVCNTLLAKTSTNEEIQSPGLSCEDCEYKILPTKMSAHKEIQSPNASCEVCNVLHEKMATNDPSLVASIPPGLSCENCEYKSLPKILTHLTMQSLSSSSEALPSKGSTDEEIQLASLTFSNEVLTLSGETYSVGVKLCTETSTNQDIHSGSGTCEALSKKKLSNESQSLNCKELFTKMSSDESQSRSGTCEELPKKKMSNESQSLSCKEFYTKMSSDESQSRSGTCEELPKKELSNESQSLNCKELYTKMSSDEEIHSGSLSCEALPTKMSTVDSKCSCCEAETESSTDSSNSQIRAMGQLSPLDPSSYSRPELAIIKHISLKLNVDFETHVLTGQAKIDFDVLQDINDLVLDASNLTIESIELEDGTQLQYKMGDHLANMGSKLTILLPKPLAADEKLTVKIKYSTNPEASALQWLDPEQTSGKKHPYLFSQCQPIHARSILPCQDTPAVKFTYNAEVTAPEEFTVLMSALRGEVKNNTTTFRQPMPLPSYLVALAVGVLESRTLGPRSKVWSEKEEIERSAWEFADTEKYLQAAEKLCGRYEWTQYDLLVLPPSFPYGGMENPCLTFVTPTLLAGDRSQADVIVHEIMHSWTGNLVTNRNFEHFWLNEGFTVFLERKVGASLINDSVEAKKSRDFQSLLGLQELNEAINDVLGPTNPLTRLVVDLNGVHPDDAFSTVPYEKGSLFLRYLEDLFGGPEVFDDFMRSYLTKFRKKSLDTEEFRRFLLDYFKDNAALKDVDWDTWLYKSGMPPIIPAYDTTMTKAISALIVKIDDPNATLSHDDVKTFTPHQMIHMLQRLIDRTALPLERLTTLGTEYKVNGNKNTEILYRWLRLCVRSRDQTKLGEVYNFVNSQGRMKYVRPLYRDLYAWQDVREQAINNFLKNEKYMMHVSAYTLRKDLHLDETTKE